MNYEKIYNQLVERVQSEDRKKLKRDDENYVYYENHHIIPVCLGGLNIKENLVLLTAREHFVAHKLLVEIFPGVGKLVNALWMMSTMKKEGRNYRVSSREYERLKILKSFSVSKETREKISKNNLGRIRPQEEINKQKETYKNNNHTGENHHLFGKKGDLAHNYGNHNYSQESRDKIGFAIKNREKTTCEFCGYSSNNTRNMKQHHGDNCKLNPNRIEKEKLTCPHCGKSGGISIMKRWHFENCKHKSKI